MMERAAQPDALLDDWTADETGQSNSSPQFLLLCSEVEWLIRNEAYALIGGHAERTARLIMAQLAHKHHLRPSC